MRNFNESDKENSMDEIMGYIIKEESKRAKKLLTPIKRHGSLSYYLNRLSKVELDNIRKKLDVKNVSSLPKAGLINAICPEVVNRIDYIIRNLGEMEFNLLKEILKSGGTIEGNFSDFDAIEGLQGWGIGFCGSTEDLNNTVLIPDELIPGIKKCFRDKEIMHAAQTGQNFYKLVKGNLYYYGVFPIMDLYDVAKENFPKESPSELTEYLFNNTGNGKDIDIHRGYLFHWMVTDPEHIIQEHKARPNLDYIQISIDKAIAAADDDYRDWNQNTRLLYDFFINTGKLSFEEAEEMVDICIEDIKNDVRFTEIVNYVGDNIKLPNFKTAEKMIEIFQNVYNSISKWVLKGHASCEVFEEEKKYMKPLPAKSQKIGRNEPCPCGSGKKYKNCCGRS